LLTTARKLLEASTEEDRAHTADRRTIRVNQGVVMRRLTLLIRCEEGANAIEFCLVATLIAIAAYAAFIQLGDKINNMYGNVSNQLPSN
jgi:Flp pilus assembly pilin Flp